jgi:predicted alpha/beta superfamily hydrolase
MHHYNSIRFHHALFLLLVLPLCLFAQANQNPAFELPRTEVIGIQDTGTKRSYELHVQLPLNYSSDKKYPVVYMTDSPYTFPIATGAARVPVNLKRMEDVMFVGISWEKGKEPALSRQRDYTPTASSPGYKDPSGEASRHLEFIRADVIPYIEKRYNTDAANRTYVGNSFGGLLGLYILLREPTTFKNYIIGSPSIWWDNKYILDLESKTRFNKDLEANVFIAVGAEETITRDSPKHDMVGDARTFHTRLKARNLDKLNVELRVIEHATHAIAFPTTAVQGLWWLFKTDRKGRQ